MEAALETDTEDELTTLIDEDELSDETVTDEMLVEFGSDELNVASVEVLAAVTIDEVEATDEVVGVELVSADAAAVGMLTAFLATTSLYCLISMTAASSNTWIFLRHLILASTAWRSCPSMAASSPADRPSKFGGGIGGGAVKGRKGNGGNTKGGRGAAPAPPEAVVEIVGGEVAAVA